MLRILIADDHAILRQGLARLLTENDAYEVVGEASDGLEAVEMARTFSPEIVLIDIGMPEMNGVDATRRILQRNPETKVIALSMHADPQFVTAMLKSGAKGYVLKDAAYAEVLSAIDSVAQGKLYISPTVAGAVVSDYINGDGEENGELSKISSREREVLQLLSEGFSTQIIGEKLHISVKTVDTHRKNLMEKLGLHSVAELTKFAVRNGLTTLD